MKEFILTNRRENSAILEKDKFNLLNRSCKLYKNIEDELLKSITFLKEKVNDLSENRIDKIMYK